MLPLPLLILLLGSPVLSAPTSSINDAFRAIAVHVPRKTDPPICCLKPLQPIDSMEDELLLSFEDWKQKQFAVQEKEKERALKERDHNRSAHAIASKGSGVNVNGNDTHASVQDVHNTSYSGDVVRQPAHNPETEPLPPHFRAPLTDRFNYASVECSARVHLANRLSKSSSSILSSKRDRYMLSPCNPPNKEKQFVVVELCEDIRIDTVQLANFEFFSGIFKDFRISVAKTHITREDAWTDVGLFRAKNVRGVQSFHPPTSLRDFYRYIRIEFLSHYGNEYYCPVSLLRVYGLTHLEQWKWDIWEQESGAKLDASIDEARLIRTPAVAIASPTSIETVAGSSSGDNDSEARIRQKLPQRSEIPATVVQEDSSRSTTIDEDSGFHLSAWKLSPSSPSAQPSLQHQTTLSNSDSHAPTPSPHVSNPTGSQSPTLDPASTFTLLQTDSPSSTTHHSQVPTSVATHMPFLSDNPSVNNSVVTSKTSQSHTSRAITSSKSAVTAAAITATTTSIVVISTVSPHSVPSTTGGESIYKTIMNRLTALEASNTLYTRYVEQQTGAVRELMKRLMEDVGRLEGIGKAQNLMYQRTLRDWEMRQQQLQIEYGVLMARVEYLADEIVLEKRLGIAQLCLLLAVLVFMGLTRGSRGDAAAQPVHFTGSSMREWGRRHLSLSGDWSKHFGRGRSRDIPKPHSAAAWPVPLNPHPDVVDDLRFNLRSSREDKRMPLEPLHMNARSSSNSPRVPSSSFSKAKSRSRTPSMRNDAAATRLPHHYSLPKPPSTPTNTNMERPRLQRSSSQTGAAGAGVGGTGTGPHKSTKKWARTAHLHEVRSVERRRARVDSGSRSRARSGGGGGDENDAGEVDPFWVGENSVDERLKIVKGDDGRSGVRPNKKQCLEEGEGDGWVDTDFEGEDGDIWKLHRGRLVAFPGIEDG